MSNKCNELQIELTYDDFELSKKVSSKYSRLYTYIFLGTSLLFSAFLIILAFIMQEISIMVFIFLGFVTIFTFFIFTQISYKFALAGHKYNWKNIIFILTADKNKFRVSFINSRDEKIVYREQSYNVSDVKKAVEVEGFVILVFFIGEIAIPSDIFYEYVVKYLPNVNVEKWNKKGGR